MFDSRFWEIEKFIGEKNIRHLAVHTKIGIYFEMFVNCVEECRGELRCEVGE